MKFLLMWTIIIAGQSNLAPSSGSAEFDDAQACVRAGNVLTDRHRKMTFRDIHVDWQCSPKSSSADVVQEMEK